MKDNTKERLIENQFFHTKSFYTKIDFELLGFIYNAIIPATLLRDFKHCDLLITYWTT